MHKELSKENGVNSPKLPMTRHMFSRTLSNLPWVNPLMHTSSGTYTGGAKPFTLGKHFGKCRP